MRKLMFFVLVSVFCLSCGTARAGLAYPDPVGGWKYVYTGDAAAGGLPDSGYTSLDGTWSHDNGSDVWDGTAIGLGGWGGVSALGGYVRLQDCGNATNHG